ncbi:MAG: hypothetical protein ACOXZS_03855 [Bacilli bacterium]
MENKKYLYLLIPFGLVLISVGLLALYNKPGETVNGLAFITKSPTFTSAIAEIMDEQNTIIGEAEIHSNVFWKGEKTKVEYNRRGKKYYITKIESMAETRQEKAKLVNHISTDVTIRKYRNMANITITQESGEPIALYPLQAIPEKIAGQEYTNMVTPNEYFEIQKYKKETKLHEKDLDVTFTITNDFDVLSFDNIAEDGTATEITYEVKHNKDDDSNSILFKTIGNGVYSIRVKFKNGDTINYIFLI